MNFKRTKKLVTVGLCSLAMGLNPSIVKATTVGTLSFNGTNTATVSSTFTQEVKVSGNGAAMTSAQGKITTSDATCVKLKTIDKVNAFTSNVNTGKFGFLDSDGKSGDFVIVRLTFETGSSPCTAQITLSSGEILLKDNTSGSLTPVSKTITVGEAAPAKSNDATLKSLSPSTGSLSPAFAAATTTYTLEVGEDVTSVNFTGAVNNSKATITSGTTCNLTGTTTACKIVVKAEDNSTKTYTVNVKKPNTGGENTNPTPTPTDTKSDDATLSKLDVSGYTLSPAFDKDKTSYSMTVGSNISSLKVNAIASDSKATVEVNGNDGWQEGMNTITITVTAENGNKKIYTVNVTKKAANDNGNTATKQPVKSSDNYLGNLTVSNGELSPKFNKETNSYSIVVPSDVDKLDLKTTLSNGKATVKVTGNENLKVGLNTVIIQVTAEDGSTRYYTINVTKKEEKGNNKLSSLTIDGYQMDPIFNKDVYTYDLTVTGNVDSLNIRALTDNENAKVEIVGNKGLKEGNNVILVKVTDENGFVQYYTLNVAKQEAKFLGLTWRHWLLVSGFALLIGLLAFIIVLLKRKKEKKVNVVEKQAPVIEFKPEFNFSSKNGTDDDFVEEGGVLNQYGDTIQEKAPKKRVEEAEYRDKPEEIPYDPYDETVTKAEIVDAIHEALDTKNPEKLKMLLDQDELNQRKKEIKRKERMRGHDYDEK